MSVETFAVPVKFKHTFVLGSGSVGAAGASGNVVFVKITTDCGVVGWGEQRALPSWSYETVETIAVVIERYFAPLLTQLSPFDVELFHAQANSLLSPSVSNGFPFARAAVDIAMHDAAGKIAGVPVHALLGGKVVSELKLCSAIGVDSAQAMAGRAVESSDYHAYKIKISGDVARDTTAIHAVAGAVGGKPLWLDANQSYQPSGMLQLLKNIADIPNLRCVEQPVASTNWAGMQTLRASMTVPLAIDEGSFTATDLARNIALNTADMVVVKICKAGGIRNALKTSHVAGANGIEILASGLTDCGVAFAASLHLFSLMNLALPAELNGPELLADLYVEGLDITNAVATVPNGPGLGVTVDEERIRFEAKTP
ncbi:mandelate racemase/muconate lactonizing enzyme family protein [Arthrobacter sp. HLT1-20]